MNLHAIVGPIISVVNPTVDVSVLVSAGYTTNAAKQRTPVYETPGALVGSIAGNILTVTSASAGVLAVGQAIAGAGVAPGTEILSLGTGTGGAGTYALNGSQNVNEQALTTSLVVPAQIQSLTFRDLTQIDGLNLQGIKHAIYFYGRFDGIVREKIKGGDLVIFPDGTTWLINVILEYWNESGWCKAAVTQQNDTAG